MKAASRGSTSIYHFGENPPALNASSRAAIHGASLRFSGGLLPGALPRLPARDTLSAGGASSLSRGVGGYFSRSKHSTFHMIKAYHIPTLYASEILDVPGARNEGS